LQPLNLRNVVRDLKPVLQRLVGEKVRIELHEAAELPLVQASVVHLEQLLLNLVINARDAMAEGGVLTITTGLQRAATALGEDGAQRVVLQVRDTGIGMDEATQAAIFDAFFTTKASQGGAGLGLSIVRDVVDRHGGTIRVESALGQGSTFEVTFPSVRTSAEDDARAASFAAQPAD
ncbi:MAG TPA: ATP-binding protein, partial [Polyangiales bacterium]|nr:ATP-binding protein [Polyangiales bacterium]